MDYWQFPTVSMGLGPLQAIYQARFMRYLEHRGFLPESDRKVWAFLGDGEMDEPESLGAISLASREKLDNLIFVVNCNLQRLDGPVRGNGKIIQELEAKFRGSGWNVIKVLWGWALGSAVRCATSDGLLPKRLMMECVDGEYQNFKSKDGKFVREKFFGKYPELLEMVANMSDEEDLEPEPRRPRCAQGVCGLQGGGGPQGPAHRDPCQTVKGFGMGKGGQGAMGAHQQKKLDENALKGFRDTFNIPVSDEDIAKVPFARPAEDSEEIKYLKASAQVARRLSAAAHARGRGAEVPGLDFFKNFLESTGDREISSTMAIVRIITALVKDKGIGKHIVPIVPDEARTFGMEGLFRQIGIYSSVGQLYEPADADQLMFYKEAQIRPDPGGGHHRGRLHGFVDRGGHRLQQPRHPDGAVLYLLLHVRISSAPATWPGPRATSRPAASSSAVPPGVPPWKARACSTRTATATCCRPPSPTACPTTPPICMKWR